MMIGTDCTGSCKSNYHTITTIFHFNFEVLPNKLYRPHNIIIMPKIQYLSSTFLVASRPLYAIPVEFGSYCHNGLKAIMKMKYDNEGQQTPREAKCHMAFAQVSNKIPKR
jgi:hypothetical protein